MATEAQKRSEISRRSDEGRCGAGIMRKFGMATCTRWPRLLMQAFQPANDLARRVHQLSLQLARGAIGGYSGPRMWQKFKGHLGFLEWGKRGPRLKRSETGADRRL